MHKNRKKINFSVTMETVRMTINTTRLLKINMRKKKFTRRNMNINMITK